MEEGVLRDWGWGRTTKKGGGGGAGSIPGVSKCTSLAVCEEFMCVGTLQGNIIWYHRPTATTQILNTQQYSAITFVKIVSTVDFMVAAGNKNGTVTIFQIPKAHPESLPKSLRLKETQSIERFTVGDLHKSEITYIEWSKNGMRLFSGDKNGLVVMTEIDFYMHICKSSEIINESYEIVQISYLQDYLLVSSVFRSIICHKINSKWDVTQVGKKERKSLLKLGGVFHFNYDKPNDINIYCGRPGFRLWTSDKEGNVLQTLLFKDAISNPTTHVELLKPHKKTAKSAKELGFGQIHIFCDKYLITYNEDQLFILNPENLVAIAVIDNLKKISVVSVNKDEIFVLDDEVDIVRIAYHPDFQEDKSDKNLMTKSLTNPIQLAVNTIKDIAETESQVTFSDMADSCDSFLSSIGYSDKRRYTKDSNIVPAEECFEDSFDLPPIKELPFEIDTNILDKIMHRYVSEEEGIVDDRQVDQQVKLLKEVSEELLFTEIPHVVKKTSRSNIIDFDEENQSKDNEHDVKSDKKKNQEPKRVKPISTISSIKINKSYIHEDISPDTLEKEIQDKEAILAKMLNLEPVVCKKPEKKKEDKTVDVVTNKLQEVNLNKSDIGKPVRSNLVLKAPLKKNANHSSKLTMPSPECVTIPEQWNIKNIEIVTSPTNGQKTNIFPNKQRQRIPSLEDNSDWVLL